MCPSRVLLIIILCFTAGAISSCNYTVGPEIQSGSIGGFGADVKRPRPETVADLSLFRLPPILEHECDTNTGDRARNIVADGVAPVIASDFTAAREEAVMDALMKAMETHNGVRINGRTVVSDGLLLTSDVESSVVGFVSGYSMVYESIAGGMYHVRVCAAVSPASSIATFPFGITPDDKVEIRGNGAGCPFAYKSLADGLRVTGASTAPTGGNIKIVISCDDPRKLDEAPLGLTAISTVFSIRAERIGTKGNICRINDERIIGLGKTEETALLDMAGNGDLEMRATLLRYCMVTPIELIRLRIIFPAHTNPPQELIEKIKSIRWTRKIALLSSDDYAALMDIYSVLPTPVFAKRLSIMKNVRLVRENGNMIEIYFPDIAGTLAHGNPGD